MHLYSILICLCFVRALYSLYTIFDIQQSVTPISSHVTVVAVYPNTTDVIVMMIVEIIVMKKDVIHTVRVIIIVSLYITIIHTFKYCPSYVLLLGERRR